MVVPHKRPITLLGSKRIPACRVVTVKAPLVVAHRLFRMTKPRSSRLNWRFYSHNRGHSISVNRPSSFISCPSRLARFAGLIPNVFLRSQCVPEWFIHKIGFYGHRNRQMILSLRHAVDSAGPTTLRKRLHNIARLKEPDVKMAIPVVYVRPIFDRLVDRKAVNVLSKVYPNMKCVNISAGHFVALSHPQECASVIIRQTMSVTPNLENPT